MQRIFSSIACNLDSNVLAAALPIFETGKVEAIEWSFDALYHHPEIPGWFNDLLSTYADAGRLVGHRVFFSLFSGGWSAAQADWLSQLASLSKQFRFDHISEHVGFMTGVDFHTGAPLGIPFNQATLAIGRDRLARISGACNCPVGLENLAFSYSAEEVRRQGDFLDELLQPVNSFLILDLHNIYCQSHNFSIDANELIRCNPLHRVREIHISGGSWERSCLDPAMSIRRDTHDDAVPPEVFGLLESTIARCPQLKFVVLEQLGCGLDTVEKQQAFQQDFARMQRLVLKATLTSIPIPPNDFLAGEFTLTVPPVTDQLLLQQQHALSAILETATSYEAAKAMLQASVLAGSDWQVESWSPPMLETAIAIAQKWKQGWSIAQHALL